MFSRLHGGLYRSFVSLVGRPDSDMTVPAHHNIAGGGGGQAGGGGGQAAPPSHRRSIELQEFSAAEQRETERVAMTEVARQEADTQANEEASRKRRKDAENELWEAELAAYRHN